MMNGEKIKFTLENGKKYDSNDKEQLLLIPELLETNIKKLNEWEVSNRIYNYFQTNTKYEEVHDFYDGFARIKNNNLYGYINEEGEEVISCQYVEATDFHEDLALVRKDACTLYINKNGEKANTNQYDYVDAFHEGLARVHKRQTSVVKGTNPYYIDSNSNRNIIGPYGSYNIQGEKYHMHTCLEKEDLYGYINKEGKMIIPYRYDYAHDFHEDLARIMKYGRYGYINKEGVKVIPCRYNKANDFHEGLACVSRDRLYDFNYNYINKKGEEIISVYYQYAGDFQEGHARVKKNGKYGFINKEGKEVIPCIYEIVHDFYEDLASVKKNGKYGYINKEGKEVIPCVYDTADDFHNGYARVVLKEKQFYINKNGEKSDLWIHNCGGKVSVYNGKVGFIYYDTHYYYFNLDKINVLDKKIDSVIKTITNLTDSCDKNSLAVSYNLKTQSISIVKKWDRSLGLKNEQENSIQENEENANILKRQLCKQEN